MVIFFSASAAEIAQQLRQSFTAGPVGIYYSKDERAVAQAAALSQVRVFIVNTFITRFSATAVVTACLIRVFTPFVESAWLFMFAGVIGTISSLLLEFTASGKA